MSQALYVVLVSASLIAALAQRRAVPQRIPALQADATTSLGPSSGDPREIHTIVTTGIDSHELGHRSKHPKAWSPSDQTEIKASHRPDLYRQRVSSVVHHGRLAAAAIVAAVLLVLIGGFVSLRLCAAAMVCAPWITRRWLSSRRRARQEQLESELPEMAELFAVALKGGLSLSQACSQLAKTISGPLAAELDWVCERHRLGRSMSDCFCELAGLRRTRCRPIYEALVAYEIHGVAVTASLVDAADQMRRLRHNELHAAARRLPVKLLFPLVICVLPAFVLLTIIPVLIDSLHRFQVL